MTWPAVVLTAEAVSLDAPAVRRLMRTALVVWLPPTAKLDAPSVVHLMYPGVCMPRTAPMVSDIAPSTIVFRCPGAAAAPSPPLPPEPPVPPPAACAPDRSRARSDQGVRPAASAAA